MLTCLQRYSTAVLLLVFIASEAASGVDVMKAVGDQVSFRPDTPLPLPVSSIIWKHKNSAAVIVKAIEWDKDEKDLLIPNPRFQGITRLDEKTGQITITGLKLEHSGVYTIDINSKEQEQRFTLTVKKRVPKPVIKKEPIAGNTNVVYLRCEYSEPIIWKNSTGHILKGSAITPEGESITVTKNGDPENCYTCTLDNGASNETSDPICERDLFQDGSDSGIGPGGIAGIVIVFLLLIIGGISGFLYKRNKNFKELVGNVFPCINEGQYTAANKDNPSPTTDKTQPDEENINSV